MNQLATIKANINRCQIILNIKKTTIFFTRSPQVHKSNHGIIFINAIVVRYLNLHYFFLFIIFNYLIVIDVEYTVKDTVLKPKKEKKPNIEKKFLQKDKNFLIKKLNKNIKHYKYLQEKFTNFRILYENKEKIKILKENKRYINAKGNIQLAKNFEKSCKIIQNDFLTDFNNEKNENKIKVLTNIILKSEKKLDKIINSIFNNMFTMYDHKSYLKHKKKNEKSSNDS